MAFHTKRRHFRPRMPEIAGLLLLAASIAAGAQWYVKQSRDAALKRTTGRIVQVTGSEAAAPRLMFTYTVGGVTYSSMTEPDLAGRTLAALLPVDILAKLNARGIFDFDDLPEEVRRQIREGTSHSFDELRDQDRRSLEQRGYQNADQLRLALLAAMDGEAGGADAASQDGAIAMGVSVPVLYDPDDPAHGVVAGPDGRIRTTTAGGLTPVLILAFATCAYFATVYPWLKRRTA